MPKNKVSDPITDQEIAFARLVLSGAMTDRHAAEAVGLNPDSAAYTKSKPRVRAYMLEHRAAVQQQLVQQEADVRRAVDGLHRLEPGPRTSTGPPLGNRQPQPRNDPRQHYRPGQGPLHDRGHAKTSSPTVAPSPPRKNLPLLPPRKSMPPPGFASSRPQPSTRSQALPQPGRRFACRPRLSPVPASRGACRGSPSHSRLGGRGASGPWPHQSTFANPFNPSEAPPWPLMSPVRFCSRPESAFLHKERTPLPAPAELPIPKRTQKYRIL